MYKIIGNYFNYSDNRGSLQGLVNFGEWEEINLIHSIASSKRGGHYHKQTDELFIILSGEIEVTLQKVKDKQITSKSETITVQSGDVFLIEPMVMHTFHIQKDSSWLNVLSKKINSDCPDIHRLQE